MRKQQGFSLIELMVAIAVLGILVKIALPMYRSQVQKSQLADARAALLQNAQYMERIYSQQGGYQTGTVAAASTSYYSIAFDTGSPVSSTYTMVALSSASGTTATNAAIDQNGTVACFTLATAGGARTSTTCP